jgi:hypothetical protein
MIEPTDATPVGSSPMLQVTLLFLRNYACHGVLMESGFQLCIKADSTLGLSGHEGGVDVCSVSSGSCFMLLMLPVALLDDILLGLSMLWLRESCSDCDGPVASSSCLLWW